VQRLHDVRADGQVGDQLGGGAFPGLEQPGRVVHGVGAVDDRLAGHASAGRFRFGEHVAQALPRHGDHHDVAAAGHVSRRHDTGGRAESLDDGRGLLRRAPADHDDVPGSSPCLP
jgi:hypothetical protein